MSRTAPAGHVYVRDRHAAVHLARYELGVDRSPALCGIAPAASFNAVTHRWDGPPRWDDVRREIPSFPAVCPQCLEAAG
jgi:hypothetical protein